MTDLSADVMHEIRIPCHDVILDGILFMPAAARGLVIFAHGSGSSRLSTRNQHVADVLNKAGLATLLFDLFTLDEDSIDTKTRELRFNIEFLAQRLAVVTNWCAQSLPAFNYGYFGASTGAAAAIVAASKLPSLIKAVVSRGGRPDLARQALARMTAPTLLIVGSEDKDVIVMNEDAQQQMRNENELVIVPHATHLFEEPGTLDQVAVLAQNWFIKYLN